MSLASAVCKLLERTWGCMAIVQLLTAMLVVQPVLVLESEEAVAEVMQLKTMPIAGACTIDFCLIPFLAFCLIPFMADSCTCIALLLLGAPFFKNPRGCCVYSCQISSCASLHACGGHSRLLGLLSISLVPEESRQFHVCFQRPHPSFFCPLPSCSTIRPMHIGDCQDTICWPSLYNTLHADGVHAG